MTPAVSRYRCARSRSCAQIGRARGDLLFEHLAVLVVVVAVGFQTQQVPDPRAQLDAVDGLGEELLGSRANPSIRDF